MTTVAVLFAFQWPFPADLQDGAEKSLEPKMLDQKKTTGQLILGSNELRLKIERLFKYRSLINPDRAIEIYKSLREKMLGLIEKGPSVSKDSFEKTLLSVNLEIDKLFSLLKESEKSILAERQALLNIVILAKQLKEKLTEGDETYGLTEGI